MTEVRITDEVDGAMIDALRERVIDYNLAATGLTVGRSRAASSVTWTVS